MSEDMQEEWRPVPGYEGAVEASGLGRLRSVARRVRGRGAGTRPIEAQILRPSLNPSGYLVISVRAAGGKATQKTVHRLVAKSFLPAVPDDMQINHIDGDKQNNRISNLEVCTAAYNCQHRSSVLGLNRGSKNKGARLTEETAMLAVELIKSGVTQHEVARIIGVSRSTVSHVYYGITWKHVTARSPLPSASPLGPCATP